MFRALHGIAPKVATHLVVVLVPVRSCLYVRYSRSMDADCVLITEPCGGGVRSGESKEPRMKDLPILGVVDGTDEEAAWRAWQLVADAVDDALLIPGLPSGDYERLLRCRRHARTAAQQPVLALARTGP